MLDAPKEPLGGAFRPGIGAFLTPLRYPGGKGRLGPWLSHVLAHNDLNGGWYIEPYAGGAGAAIYLLRERHVEHVVINDADPAIFAFWWSVTKHSSQFVPLIKKAKLSVREWERQRKVLSEPTKHDRLELGFAAFYLNRTNRSGILAGGLIGGKEQDGPYKMGARFDKTSLSERVRAIGSLSKRITVLGLDALELLRDVGPGFPQKSLVYVDPPYFAKGRLLYRNHYALQDHAAIADCLSWASFPFVVTYDDCAEIRHLYRDFLASRFRLQYSTHETRPRASELVFYQNLTLPFAPELTKGFALERRLGKREGATSQHRA
jgi:DNA adenine methylase